MRIETHIDLRAAWNCCTILGKFFFFPFMVVGWIMLFIVSLYLTGSVEFGTAVGFLTFNNNESEEDEETDTSS